MLGHEDRVSPACDNRLSIRSGSTLKFSPADVPAGAGVGVLEDSPEECIRIGRLTVCRCVREQPRGIH